MVESKGKRGFSSHTFILIYLSAEHSEIWNAFKTDMICLCAQMCGKLCFPCFSVKLFKYFHLLTIWGIYYKLIAYVFNLDINQESHRCSFFGKNLTTDTHAHVCIYSQIHVVIWNNNLYQHEFGKIALVRSGKAISELYKTSQRNALKLDITMVYILYDAEVTPLPPKKITNVLQKF